MKSSYTTLMQSKFFSPAFNSAIFDGPVRIYFAQFHESLALKIYFLIQQKLSNEVAQAKEISKACGANILIMVYPTVDSFTLSFESESDPSRILSIENWQEDVVIGLRGPIEDDKLDLLIDTVRQSIRTWKPESLPLDYKTSYGRPAEL